MKTDEAAIRDELTVALTTTLNHGHPVNDVNESQATMLAVEKRTVPAWNVNIHRNQNGGNEQSESNIKSTATVMPSKADAKQHEDEESSRCCEAENEEEGRNAKTYRDLNETQFLILLSFGIHNGRANDA